MTVHLLQVLTDVFQYHVPPVRRVPQLLLVRLRHNIAQYVVNREADGAMVTYWYHRQFIEAAQARFVNLNLPLLFLRLLCDCVVLRLCAVFS